MSQPYRPYHTHKEIQRLTPGEVLGLDVEIWPTSIVVPAGYTVGLSIRGKNYEYAGAGGEKLSNIKNELRGCGPFLQDEPRNRPHEIFDNEVTLHGGGDCESFVLLPLTPAKT